MKISPLIVYPKLAAFQHYLVTEDTSTRHGYLKWVNEWKEEYAFLSKQILTLKRLRKRDPHVNPTEESAKFHAANRHINYHLDEDAIERYQGIAVMTLIEQQKLANFMLKLRKQNKILARHYSNRAN